MVLYLAPFQRHCRFAGFLLRTTPPLFRPNFRGVTLGLVCRCCGSEEQDRKLNIGVITFELTQHDHDTTTFTGALRGKNRQQLVKLVKLKLEFNFNDCKTTYIVELLSIRGRPCLRDKISGHGLELHDLVFVLELEI